MKKLFSVLLVLIASNTLFAQRNTVLIIADDVSPDYFGFYEDHVDTVAVPNLRKLLLKGVRFNNLMSNPVCSSTRTTILTGRYSFRTCVGGIVGGSGGSNQIDTAEISIPKLLKVYNANIANADIGKWHLKQPAPAYNLMSPQALGFDWFEGPFIGQLPSFTNWTKYTNGIASNITTYATTENVNNAVTWVKTVNANKPFFLWLAFNAPHEPLHLPPAGLHTYTTLSGTMANINAQPKEYFKAMIQAMDHEIGRLMDSLQVLNKLDSTDFIFIGDNGSTPRTAQIADTSRAKGTVYQYGVHVPMIIAGPSVVNPNRVSNALVNTTDIFATIAENFGYTNWQMQIPTNKPVDSKSIMPIIKNTSDSIRPWSFCEIFKLTTDSADGKAMRNKDYKLIKFNYGAEELYNLSTDPLETNNLLSGSMSAADISNYYYLCNQMTSLVGAGSFCKSGVGVTDTKYVVNLIYPNPTNGIVYIKDDVKTNSAINMCHVDGRIIFSKKAMAATIQTIDVATLPTGVYLLQYTNANNLPISTTIYKK